MLYNHARLMSQDNHSKDYLVSMMFSHYDRNNNGNLEATELNEVRILLWSFYESFINVSGITLFVVYFSFAILLPSYCNDITNSVLFFYCQCDFNCYHLKAARKIVHEKTITQESFYAVFPIVNSDQIVFNPFLNHILNI